MKIAYNAILCYLGWQSKGKKFKFSIKNFFIAHGLCSARRAEQERQRKKMSSGGSEIDVLCQFHSYNSLVQRISKLEEENHRRENRNRDHAIMYLRLAEEISSENGLNF